MWKGGLYWQCALHLCLRTAIPAATTTISTTASTWRRSRYPPATAPTKPTHNLLPTYSLLPCARFAVRVVVPLSARSFMPSMRFLSITMSPTSWIK